MKNQKICNLVNYHICIFSVRTIQTDVNLRNKFEKKKI